MRTKPTHRRILAAAVWAVIGLLPLAGALSSAAPHHRPKPRPTRPTTPPTATTEAGQLKARIKAQLLQSTGPGPGEVVFRDPSPTPTGHNLSGSTYVGYQVCAGCHGRLTSTRPDHTIIQEWENPADNAHANDPATLIGGNVNVYTSHIGDGVPVFDSHGTQVAKQCGSCHATGGPNVTQPQDTIRDQDNPNGTDGFDCSRDWFVPTVKASDGHFTSKVDTAAWEVHKHNVRLMRVECENCHGPGSQHVLSGGDPTFINRVPDARQTCWNCHVHLPNEKGLIPTGPATDHSINTNQGPVANPLTLYTSSLGHSHNAGILVAGTGGYEYPGEDYSDGHNQPHTRIKDTCVTCHAPRNPQSPILDHSNLDPKITTCANCHGDAKRQHSVDTWLYVTRRQATVETLLIQLGGADSSGAPDANAGGGLLGAFPDKTSLKYKRARWNYSLVFNDGSLGVHNFDYALGLLLTSISDLQKP